MIEGAAASPAELTIRFFSYFTILSNILVAVTFTAMATTQARFSFWRNSSVATAIAVYILIVCLVYQLVLRQTWSPTGFQYVIDELLHSVMPALYLLFWFKYVASDKITWSHIPKWLIFPLVYLLYILGRGLLSGFYPYFFIDAGKLPPVNLAMNIAGLMSLFAIFAAAFVGVSKLIQSKKKASI